MLSGGIRGLACRISRSDEPLRAIKGRNQMNKEELGDVILYCSHAQAETKLWPGGHASKAGCRERYR